MKPLFRASWLGLALSAAALSGQTPRPLHTAGGGLYDNTGAPVVLKGLDLCSLEWENGGDHLLRSVRQAIGPWRATLIRLPITQDRWFGKMPDDPSGPDRSDGGAAYRRRADAVVALASAAGVYVLVDLHWSDMGVWGANVGQHKLPDDNSTLAWQAIAAHYANQPGVLFDAYNEPHDTPWPVWRNGGTVTEDGTAYHSPGMQGLVDTIRATGARNVIAVGGLSFAYDLSGIAKGYAIAGSNIMYSCHIYPPQPTDWDASVGPASRFGPILIGEFGAERNSDYARFFNRMIPWIEQHHYSAAAWCLHDQATPSLISNWRYDRTWWEGTYVASWLTGGPRAPSALAVDGRSGRLALAWPAVPGATGYRVYRSAKPGHEADFKPLAQNLTHPEYVDSNPANGATYYYRVTTLSPAGASGFSLEMGGTAGRPGGFEAPQPAFKFGAVVTNLPAATQRPITIDATATDVGPAGGDSVLIVVSVHDADDQNLFQQEFPHQTFRPGQSRRYTAAWTPRMAGSYRIEVGAFGDGYAPKYSWDDQTAHLTVN